MTSLGRIRKEMEVRYFCYQILLDMLTSLSQIQLGYPQ